MDWWLKIELSVESFQKQITKITYVITHTTLNSFYKWTKISSLKIDIFDLKMMVKSGLHFFYFEILLAPSEIPANLPGQFSLSGKGSSNSEGHRGISK